MVDLNSSKLQKSHFESKSESVWNWIKRRLGLCSCSYFILEELVSFTSYHHLARPANTWLCGFTDHRASAQTPWTSLWLSRRQSLWIFYATRIPSFQENCNTHTQSTPQAIPVANYERNSFKGCVPKVGWNNLRELDKESICTPPRKSLLKRVTLKMCRWKELLLECLNTFHVKHEILSPESLDDELWSDFHVDLIATSHGNCTQTWLSRRLIFCSNRLLAVSCKTCKGQSWPWDASQTRCYWECDICC